MNRLAVVTGGTKGIGKAIVKRFLEEGFDVITCARNSVDLKALQLEMQASHPGRRCMVMEADLSDRKCVEAFVDFVKGFNQSVDVLVNNTGVFIPGQIYNEADGTVEKSIETNLYSAYYLTRGLVGDMMARKKGHIFSMCSIASITAYPNGGSYSISKFALYGMTKVLREEMKPHHVKVTAILPGATLTESWAGTELPPERFIPPIDIANAVWMAYNASPGVVVEDLLIRPQLGDIN